MKIKQPVKNSSIGEKFILYIFLFSFFLVLMGTAFALYVEHRKEVYLVTQRLENIKKSQIQSIAENLWLFNEEILSNQITGILTLPYIKYLRIERYDDADIIIGEIPTHKNISRSYPLLYSYRKQEIPLGALHIKASLDPLYKRISDRVLLIVIVQFFETFLVSIFAFLLFNNLVGRHLKKMSRHTESIDSKHLENTLVLDKFPTRKDKKKDEIDQVVDSLNTMQLQLHNDILIIKQNELRLQQEIEERQKIQNAVETSIDGIILTDLKGIITYHNNSIKTIYGYENEELIGQHISIICNDVNFPKIIVPIIQEQGFWSGTYIAIRKNREIFPASLTTSFSINDDGSPIGMLGVVRDISDMKKAEKTKAALETQLQQAHKMESIGLMAGGVAHDLNNILSGIIGYPELLLKTLPKNSELRTPIEAIHESGQRAATVVADLLTIARGVAIKREDHDLNTLIEKYLNSPECKKLKSLYPNITLQQQSETTNSFIFCSPVHIQKCIMNLVTNGCEAITGAGTITLSTYNQHVDKKSISKHKIEAGEYVVLNVQDTGSGVSNKDIGHIFEPFYTKKVMGKSGSGLGLAVIWNTMEDHAGKVSVDSNEKGTSFQLYFPVKKVAPVSQIDNKHEPKVTGGDSHILVVDDEPQLRDIARMMLTSLGYSVDVVESGESAIEFVKNKSVDLLLIDMLMEPGINGRQTYEEISKLYPNQKAVVASGFSESEDVKATLQLGAGGFINKPYSMEQLGRAVKQVLDK